MDPITTAGPIHDVAEHLFLQLDKKTLMDCRLVSKAWKKFLDRHTFWFKKLTFKYAHLEEGWKSLAIVVMETNDIDNEDDQERADSGMNSMFGYTEVIKRRITNWKDVNEEFGSAGITALHTAAENGHLDIIKILIHHCAKPITHDHDGWTAMHWAARSGHLDIIKFLNDYPDSQHKRNNQGWTPLHTAVEFGQLEILKYLMQYSRYPNAPGNNGLITTMGIAASKGHVEIVKFLANHITDSTNEPDKGGWTPLHNAAFSGQLETTKVLLNYTDNPNIQDNDGQTPIDLARDSMQNCDCKKE